MNKNEIGREILINVGEDISAATTAEIILQHNAYTLTKGLSDGVSRPIVDAVFTPCDSTTQVTFLANQYLLYTTEEGDVPFSGIWTGRSHIVSSGDSPNFFGDLATFSVGE